MKFDTLFTDRKHYRADCRLVARAIRGDWVQPEDREALVRRIETATAERFDGAHSAEPGYMRALLATSAMLMAMRDGDRKIELDAARAAVDSQKSAQGRGR